VNTIYLQGASGDINPRVVGGLDGHPDSIETTHALGEEIGREVVRVYRSLAPEKVIVPCIRVVSREILLPRTYRELAANFRDPAVRVTTTAVRVGDMMWVTFPGELFNTIGKHVKAACPATVALIMGYTNGYVGYFPEQEAFAQGGYEPATSHLAPNAEQVYMREIKRLMMAFQ
jgi:neutral ceramidase